MSPLVLDLAAARRWALSARVLLSDSREHLNRLNVFPVPDGDTGTNMFLTMDGAIGMLREPIAPEGSVFGLSDGLDLLARGMLMSARGNSGVILSQLASGMSQAVHTSEGPPADQMSAQMLVDAFDRAADAAWAGVSDPVEGTILSVARAAATGAATAVAGGPVVSTAQVAQAALNAARVALARTPEQLPALARAGVVDAGGAGFVLVLEALEGVLSGRSMHSSAREVCGSTMADFETIAQQSHHTDVTSGGEGVEVMYAVYGGSEVAAERLRRDLRAIGSSVMVVGGPDLWRVHVHVDAPEPALTAGAQCGRVEQVSISSLRPDDPAEISNGIALVACASGAGVFRLFRAAGATVLSSSVGNRASTGAIVQACHDAGAAAAIVLPNDPDALAAARAAARAGGATSVDIHVVPTIAAVQGLAALSLWHPGEHTEKSSPGRVGQDARTGTAAPLELLHVMSEAAHGVQCASVTMAVTQGRTAAGWCRAGQWLGLLGDQITEIGDEVNLVAAATLVGVRERLGVEPEVLTVLTGAGIADADARAFELAVRAWASAFPRLEVQRYYGGQRTYQWLLGLE